MNFASVLLAPLALLLPAAQAIEQASPGDVGFPAGARPISGRPQDVGIWPEPVIDEETPPVGRILIDDVHPQDAWQIRIEQRVQIRITPRASVPMPLPTRMSVPEPDGGRRLRERKIGKCVAIAGIAGGDPYRTNTLLLYMRDHRVLSAELERSCRARDFYSGFYLARTKDGMLCVDRDTLLSRSGANCKITRIREVIEEPED